MKYVFHENNIEAELGHGTLSIAKEAESGFRPVELLISSIASCSGFVFQNILKKQRIQIEEFVITAEVERNEDKANRVEKIILIFHVKGNELNEKKLQRNLDVSRKYCGMIQSVEGSIDIEERLLIK